MFSSCDPLKDACVFVFFIIPLAWYGIEQRVLIVTPAAWIYFPVCCIFSNTSAFGDPARIWTNDLVAAMSCEVICLESDPAGYRTGNTAHWHGTANGPHRRTVFSQLSSRSLHSRMHVWHEWESPCPINPLSRCLIQIICLILKIF